MRSIAWIGYSANIQKNANYRCSMHWIWSVIYGYHFLESANFYTFCLKFDKQWRPHREYDRRAKWNKYKWFEMGIRVEDDAFSMSTFQRLNELDAVLASHMFAIRFSLLLIAWQKCQIEFANVICDTYTIACDCIATAAAVCFSFVLFLCECVQVHVKRLPMARARTHTSN